MKQKQREKTQDKENIKTNKKRNIIKKVDAAVNKDNKRQKE